MSEEWKDVTSEVDFGDNDAEALPLTKCVCGAVFDQWSQILSIYKDHPWTCPVCGAKLVFTIGIRVERLCDTPKSDSPSSKTQSP